MAALEDAVALGVDYVEFDVWRRDDGSFVVAHDPAHDVGLTYDSVLSAIGTRALAHIDLKFVSPGEAYDAGRAWEVDAARRAVEVARPGADDRHHGPRPRRARGAGLG